jgi:hypothetical protein
MRGNLLLSVLGLFAIANSASALTIYSDFSSLTPPFNTTTGDAWAVGGPGSSAVAADFTPTANYDLGSITLGFGYVTSGSTFNFALTTNNSGLPGTPIETWTGVPATGTYNSSVGNTITLSSTTDPELLSGQTYWLTAVEATTASYGAWNYNNLSPFAEDPDLSNNNGATWTPDFRIAPALDVLSVPTLNGKTPIPAALPGGALLMAGLLCSKFVYRKVAAK